MNIYLAGPFFNKESRCVLTKILDELEGLNHQVWIPMRDGILCPKDADQRMRQEVFKLDCQQLHWAECVVALLDYPLPIHQQLLLRERTPEGLKDIPMSLPDSGTVFEIGYVVGLNGTRKQHRNIIGYAENPGFNLMISQACDGFVNNLDRLERVINLVEQGDEKGLLLLKLQYMQELKLREF